jgi:hypothetical protein
VSEAEVMFPPEAAELATDVSRGEEVATPVYSSTIMPRVSEEAELMVTVMEAEALELAM